MKSRFIKTLCLILTLVMLINLLPLQVFGTSFQEFLGSLTLGEHINASDDALGAVSEAVTVLWENMDKRTQYSKEYRMSDGSNMAILYPEPVHYEKDGQWEEIDNTLKAVFSGLEMFYTNTAGDWDVRFPSRLGDNEITVTNDGFTLKFGMVGEIRLDDNAQVMSAASIDAGDIALKITEALESAAEIEAVDIAALKDSMEYPETFVENLFSALRYNNVFGNTDITYEISSGKIKESVILESYDAALRGYRFKLQTEGMTPAVQEDGSIAFYASDRADPVMTMDAPFLVDNAGEMSTDIEVTLVQDGESWILTYQLPVAWLADEARAWPVVLDPSVRPSGDGANVADRTVASDVTVSQTSLTLQTGIRSGYGVMRSFIRYSYLPTLKTSDVITLAQLRLYNAEASSTANLVEVRSVDAYWTASGITWNNQPGHGEFATDYASCKAKGKCYFNITEIARGWYETGVNTGLMIKAPDSVEDAGVVGYEQFYSSDHNSSPSAAVYPLLTIWYRSLGALEDYGDYTTSSAGSAGTGYVNNYSGKLTWVVGDMGFGGNRMPVSISHVYNVPVMQRDWVNSTTTEVAQAAFGMGDNWRTNFNQRVYASGSYYYWEDADGSKHKFINSSDNIYKDEDGLELTLTVNTSNFVLSDKYGNTSTFDSLGRLTMQSNNQATKSHINISYTTTDGYKISQITDGVGRKYNFSYNTSGLLNKISYTGTGTSELYSVSYGYTNGKLTSITKQGYATNKADTFTYNGDLLATASSTDGYTISYTYSTGLNKRVTGIAESQNGTAGTSLTLAYSYGNTKITDNNGNESLLRFNTFGDRAAAQDNQGRVQYNEYALTGYADTASGTLKAHQLVESSKVQGTTTNYLFDHSFEGGSLWTAIDSNVSQSVSTANAYIGAKSLAIAASTANVESGVRSAAVSVETGKHLTLSAYIKTEANATARLAFVTTTGEEVAHSETLAGGSGWTRIQVNYYNDTTGDLEVYPQLMTTASSTTSGKVYMDCVQLEAAATAGSYNLVENGDFRNGLNGWGESSYSIQTGNAPAPALDSNVLMLDGDFVSDRSVSQTIAISGSENDVIILAGWAKAEAVALSGTRGYALMLTFTGADGTTSTIGTSFSHYCSEWHYKAVDIKAPIDYTSIKLEIVYNKQPNPAYFDGIQLYREGYGSYYEYDTNGNLIKVTDTESKVTEYSYDANNNLTQVLAPDDTVTTYTYDDWHNVETITSASGAVQVYDYDVYGNNILVSVSSDPDIITTADYTDDGNRLESTTDAAGKTTYYGYDADTNVLEWVQAPEDTTETKTTYAYDEQYRLTSVTSAVAGLCDGTSLAATYGYTGDLLTSITTGSTTYTLCYEEFSQISSIHIGNRILASYTYTDDQNHYLSSMTYGNGDVISYEYDDQGRVVKEVLEDGTISYEYDVTGALATVIDSASGTETSYYYDLSDRLSKYSEISGDHSYSVSTNYDENNNITSIVETIDGFDYTTTFRYDDEGRMIESFSQVMRSYTYDSYGRLVQRFSNYGGAGMWISTETMDYYAPSDDTTSALLSRWTRDMVFEDDIEYCINYYFTYDDNGNIIAIEDGTNSLTYAYDTANQLIRENNQDLGKTYTWSYDTAGNIICRKEYAYTTGELDEPIATVNYVYSDSEWGDLLTEYNGKPITYDGMGNPITYGAWGYTWKNGRELASMTNGTTTWNFTYDANGMRKSRTNGTDSYTYVYNGDQLVFMTVGDDEYYFYIDETGPVGVKWTNGDTTEGDFFFITNAQGDVTHIMDDGQQIVVTYTYDAWGNIASMSGPMADTLGIMNPYRYRGYLYDQETGLYYLQSRYYNPEIGRFINADGYVATGQGLLGNNMFAYCNNNPVNLQDKHGCSGSIAVLGGLYAGATASGVSNIWNPVGWVVLGTVAVVTVVAITYDAYQKYGTRDKILADVKVKKQPEKTKLYQMAYINSIGMLIRVGRKMTFTEALAALGVSGAVNSVSRRYSYDTGRSSHAQRSLEHLGIGAWGIYASTQSAAKALAYTFGCTKPPEVHGWGMYGHYHDSTHSFHIWFGGVLYY